MDNKITLVTGLWDLGRSNLSNGWARSFDHYLEKFKQLLQVDNNLIIFGDENLKKIVDEHRNPDKTQFIIKNLDWFKNNDYFDLIQTIRNSPEWFEQAPWLKESTQSKLEWYNPKVMSKMFLLHDAKILDNFDSDYLFMYSLSSHSSDCVIFCCFLFLLFSLSVCGMILCCYKKNIFLFFV